MNRRQLEKLGVPPDSVRVAIKTIQRVVSVNGTRTKSIKETVKRILAEPESYLDDCDWKEFAQTVIDDRSFATPDPITYRTWGAEEIESQTHAQMTMACRLPVARAAALMADAHLGYGLPIGGVLACENAVIPSAVGVDIACRMKLSVLDISPEAMAKTPHRFDTALEQGTRFGVGSEYKRPRTHDVMDRDWTVSRVTREQKDRAWRQLGTSGSGNHFAEFGLLTVDDGPSELPLEAGTYVALLSHSGSRGTGASVCSTYSGIARSQLPRKFSDLAQLAWLDLDSQPGQEYWLAMHLMGCYAAANHDVIHSSVAQLLGAEIVTGVENHHNHAWKEIHDGRELIVHRKGATPAATGQLGVIPGSMADPAFVVRGRGDIESLHSASHGAGRRMSRTKAKSTFNWKTVRRELADRGVRVLSAGADEVPGVYKDIRDVMRRQSDLVDIVARFQPKIVKMCGDGSRPED